MKRNDFLDVLDAFAADERSRLSSADVRERLDLSPQATSNLLSRLVRAGLLDRVAHGIYSPRPLGMLGTRVASEDITLAVGAAFGSEPHRIAYRSALDHHGLIVHPARVIQVALARRTHVKQLSGRRLQATNEAIEHVLLGRQDAGHGAFVSTIERALLESAKRPGLVGGWSVLADAVSRGTWDPTRLAALAQELGGTVALRRLASIAESLGQDELIATLPTPAPHTRPTPLDPHHPDEAPWTDTRWQVRWPVTPEQAQEIAQT